MEWMLMPIRRYADFAGRSRRQEFWMFQLGVILFYIACFILISIGGAIGGETLSGILMIPFVLAVLALFVPSLAVAVRRLHDQDKSGWWLLISFIPFGGIVLIVFYCLEGTQGPNQFGPDPKGRGDQSTFE